MAEGEKLIWAILVPLFISILIAVILFGKGSWTGARWKSAFKLDPEKGLAQQGLLWLSIIIPFEYFLVFGVFSWQGHNVSLTSVGFASFASISSVPLALLSLSLPLSVLVSRVHTTKQTAKQILLTSHKNNLDSFYSHRNELFSYFDIIGEVNYLNCIDAKYKIHPRVHKIFFNGSPNDGVPEVNVVAFQDIESELRSARWEIDAVIRDINPDLTFSFYVANCCSTIYRISHKLGLKELFITLAEKSVLVPVEIKGEGSKTLLTVGTTTDELVAAYRYANNYFTNLCDFSGYELKVEDDYQYQYLDTGGKHKTINTPLVVEKLHETKIKKLIGAEQA